MSRPRRVPDRGDVPVAVVAERLGLSRVEFESQRAELERRGFPEPDPTTGNFCIEAIDRWRISRHAGLFQELTAAGGAVDAATVFHERMRRLREQG